MTRQRRTRYRENAAIPVTSNSEQRFAAKEEVCV